MHRIILVILAVLLVTVNSLFFDQVYKKTLSADAIKNNSEFKRLVNDNRKLVQNATQQQVPLILFASAPSEETNKEFENLYVTVKTPSIFRMKVWSTQYQIVWSNLRDLIGSKFTTNDAVKDSLSGETGIEISIYGQGESETRESITENLFNNYSEIYVPIKDSTGK